MISTIEKGYRNPGLLEKLMDVSSFGYSHTANIFKAYTGLSLKSFIIERKLEAAKGQLLNGGSVRESAEAAAYDDEFYFSRIFKKYTGLHLRNSEKGSDRRKNPIQIEFPGYIHLDSNTSENKYAINPRGFMQ